MKRHWLVVTILTNLAAFTFVMLWPPRPLWQATLGGEASALAFTADGRELLATSREAADRGVARAECPLRYHRLAAETGQPTAAPVTVAIPGDRPLVIPSPDGQRLFMSHRHPNKLLGHSLLDPERGTAVRLVDATADPEHGPRHFSPDGRWLWTFREGGHTNGGAVLDGLTGEPILNLKPTAYYEQWSCRFSPDSSALAVLRAAWKTGPSTVVIYDLPSGQLRRQFELPSDRKWWRLDAWAANRLHVIADDGNGARRTASFDLDSPDRGPGRDEPLRVGQWEAQNKRLWLSGPDWIAYRSPAQASPDWQQPARTWLAETTGATWLHPRAITARLTFYDAGRARSYQLPPLPQQPTISHSRLVGLLLPEVIVSRDGRRVACTTAGHLEVWDADPGPRWPWALMAGVGAMVPPLLVGRWRAKR